MRFARPRRSEAEINLTSLIDILFIVLVFLILTATFSDRGVLGVVLPVSTTAREATPGPDFIRIVLDAEGNLSLDGRPARLEELRLRLEAVADRPNASVAVAADESVRHGRVVELLDVIRRAGIVRLDIETIRRTTRGAS